MEQIKDCPRCGCPHWEASTSEPPGGQKRSHQGADGEWHIGFDQQNIIYRCHHCGWNYAIVKEWGKITKTTVGLQLLALLKDWAPQKALDNALRSQEGLEIRQASLERYKGYLDVTVRIPLSMPQDTKDPEG